tara:strand:- start:350 stop:1903 length:1554 start_codon:yes stop_codon:yes gene_type:complete
MPRDIVTVTPPDTTRKQRKAQARAAARLRTEQPSTESTPHTSTLPQAPRGTRYGARPGTGGYWNPARLVVPYHQATSHQIAGMYPFVADTGIGNRGPVVGVELNSDSLWHFSPWDAYTDTTGRGTLSTNILVLGAYRSGKSAVIKMLTTRSLAFGHQVVVPSDSKGEWAPIAEAVGGTVIRLGGTHRARLNPLDRGPRRTGATDDEDEQMVRDRRLATLGTLIEMTLPRDARLTPVEHVCVHTALDRSVTATADRPTLRSVLTQLQLLSTTRDADDEDIRAAATRPRYVLQRFVHGDLSGLFEDESTVTFDADTNMVVVDTSELFARGDFVAQLTQVCTTAWIQAVISDRAAKRTRYLVREEGWRDMGSLAALQMYQQWLKLSRHYGISNIVILHKFTDLDAVGDAESQERNLAYSITGDIENKFIFRVNHQEQHALTTRLNLPAHHTEMARGLPSGRFLAYVGQFSYLVDAFCTSTRWEYDLFDTDDAITDPTAAETVFDPAVLDAVWPEQNQEWP